MTRFGKGGRSSPHGSTFAQKSAVGLLAAGTFLLTFCWLGIGRAKLQAQGNDSSARGESPQETGESAADARQFKLMVSGILDHYFRPPPGREVVIVCDSEKSRLAQALVAGLELRRCPARVMLIGANPQSSAQTLREVLDNDHVGLMVLASPQMWKELALADRLEFRERWPSIRARASPVFFDAVTPLPNMLRLYSADPDDSRQFLASLQQQLSNDFPVRIVAPGGTDLKFVARRWEIWGWELLTYPVEETVSGTIVADAGVFFSKVRAPIRLHVRHGKLINMECADPNDPVFQQYARWMNEAHDADPRNWQLAEVGIGGNANARITDVLMETEVVRGTCHFCFGDNSMFGGQHKTTWHGGTVVIHNPRLEVGGRTVALEYHSD